MAIVSVKSGWRTLLASTALVSMSMGIGCGPAQAQTVQAQAQQFDIPAQSLASALMRFSRETRLELFYSAELAQGKTTQGVSGNFAPPEALSRLLAGTGLTFRFINTTTITIEPAPQASGGAITLGPVRVEGSAADRGDSPVPLGGNLRGPSDDPVANRLNPQTTVGTKNPVNQREIPQTISVITQDQIQIQNLLNINDVLANAPGITVAQQANNDRGTGEFIYSRGWQITNYNVDGIPTLIDTLPVLSTAGYERVEILHGASGLYNGMGGAGGTIAMVRKQPLNTPALSAAAGAGSNDTFFGQVDVSEPLNKAGTIRTRSVVSWQRQGLDSGAYTKTNTFYGVLEAEFPTNNTVQVGVSYDYSTGKPEQSFPTYADGSFYKASSSNYYYPKWNRVENENLTVFGNVTHDFGNGWKAKLNASYLRTHWSILRGFSTRAIDANSNVRAFSVKADGISSQTAIDAFASGPFELFGRTHNLTFGANYLFNKTPYDFESAYWGSVPFDSLRNLEPDFSNLLIASHDEARITDYGAYINARFSLADPLTLLVGGRLAWYKGDDTWNDKHYYYRRKITPFAGFVYDFSKTYSAYASYSSIFKPASAKDKEGNMLKPLEGEQYEIGLKGVYLNGRASASLALFSGTQNNRAVQDPDDPTGTYYLATGKARVQGVEFLVSGEVLPNLTVMGGYTYLHTKIFDNNAEGTSFTTIAPKHMLKLQARYDLPGNFDRWRVGGGVTVSSSEYAVSDEVTVRGPSYAVFDASIGYKLDRNLRIDLSAKNIFNRYYWSTISGTANGNYLGQGRNVMATLRAAY